MRSAECGVYRAAVEPVAGFCGWTLALQFRIPRSALRTRGGGGGARCGSCCSASRRRGGALAGWRGGRWDEGGDGGVRGDDGGGARERRPGHADPRAMSPSRGDHRLILASGSPRRRELLDMLGLPFRVIVPAVDETRKTSEVPDRYVVRIARDKALAVAPQQPGAVVLAADTAGVPREEAVFGKHR